MTTRVSSASAFLASGAAAKGDLSRESESGALMVTFSSLLRGQLQGGSLDARTNNVTSLANSNPEPARPAPEPVRESINRPHAAAPREPQRANERMGREAPQRTAKAENSRETGANALDKTHHNTSPNPNNPNSPDSTDTATASADGIPENKGGGPQSPFPDAASDAGIPFGLSATIAVLLGGMASEPVSVAVDGDSALEALPQKIAVDADEASGGDMQDMLEQNASDSENGKPLGADASAKNSHLPATASDVAKVAANSLTPASLHGHSAATLDTSHAAQIKALSPDALNNVAYAPPAASGAGSAALTSTAQADALPLLNLSRPAQADAVMPRFTVPAGTGQKAWAEEIGNRVMWMLGRAENRAELILTPPQLGKVEVSIHLNGDQGTAQFLASSQAARDALEQALPRLRELLAQAGINLGEAGVNTSAESRAQDNGENTHHAPGYPSGLLDESGDADATSITPVNWLNLDNGLVNTFA